MRSRSVPWGKHIGAPDEGVAAGTFGLEDNHQRVVPPYRRSESSDRRLNLFLDLNVRLNWRVQINIDISRAHGDDECVPRTSVAVFC